MTKKYTFKVRSSEQARRLDVYLSGLEEISSRSFAQNLIDKNQVLVNGRKEKASYKTRENDEISIILSDESSFIIEPENIPLDIIYEDKSMLVINKPKNMLSHPVPEETKGTLVNALLFKYGYEGLSDLGGLMRPGIVHRLDRNTSGLLMIAKNNEAHEFLQQQIKDKTALRQYVSIVKGIFKEKEGEINLPIERSRKHPEKMEVQEGGKPSITKYRVLEEFKDYSYIELTLLTGRTHQIRVHMSYIGHPVINDSLYNKEKFKVKTQEQVLCAYKLQFASMCNDDIINLEIEPDEDVKKVLRYLRSLK